MKFILALCAILVGAGFIEQLAKIKEIKRDARKPKKLDKMMLTHHNDCVFWNTNYKKCDCFMLWVYKDLKELQKYHEQSKKQEIW